MSLAKYVYTTAILGTASAASAAIIPSWRVNPISAGAIADVPALANAVSVSLMVELTGGSLFNVAGLDLAPLLPGVTFFNDPNGSTATTPHPVFFNIPGFRSTQFDSYVSITGPTSQTTPASVPGRKNGNGTAQVGDGGFNVAWGATPNSGGTGLLEIARITVFDVSVAPAGSGTAVPFSNGLVADSLNPNSNIPLPPIPIYAMPAVPEPMSLAIAGIGVLMLALPSNRR